MNPWHRSHGVATVHLYTLGRPHVTRSRVRTLSAADCQRVRGVPYERERREGPLVVMSSASPSLVLHASSVLVLRQSVPRCWVTRRAARHVAAERERHVAGPAPRTDSTAVLHYSSDPHSLLHVSSVSSRSLLRSTHCCAPTHCCGRRRKCLWCLLRLEQLL